MKILLENHTELTYAKNMSYNGFLFPLSFLSHSLHFMQLAIIFTINCSKSCVRENISAPLFGNRFISDLLITHFEKLEI